MEYLLANNINSKQIDVILQEQVADMKDDAYLIDSGILDKAIKKITEQGVKFSRNEMKSTRNPTIESWGYKYKSEIPMSHTKVSLMPTIPNSSHNVAIVGAFDSYNYYGVFETFDEAWDYIKDNHLTRIDDEGFAFEY